MRWGNERRAPAIGRWRRARLGAERVQARLLAPRRLGGDRKRQREPREDANTLDAGGAQSMQPSEGSTGDQVQDTNNPDDATVKAAEAISEHVFGHELQENEKRPAGAAVHYFFGIAMGGLYGALAEISPQVTTGAGLPFGAVFWLAADEVTVPLLGLSKGPTEYPLSTHAYAFASHLLYGVTTEFSRRALRHVL